MASESHDLPRTWTFTVALKANAGSHQRETPRNGVDEDRTHNLLDATEALSQLSYHPMGGRKYIKALVGGLVGGFVSGLVSRHRTNMGNLTRRERPVSFATHALSCGNSARHRTTHSA